MEIGNRIKEIIKSLGLNNSSFASKIGVSNTTVDGYIKGRKDSKGNIVISKPNYDVLKKIINIFDINPYYLFGISDEMFSNVEIKNLQSVAEFVVEKEDKLKENITFKLWFKSKVLEGVIEFLEVKNKE